MPTRVVAWLGGINKLFARQNHSFSMQGSALSESPVHQWFQQEGWQPFPFQEETWQAYLSGSSGLLNAPTGSGKTYALWLACLLEYIRDHPDDYHLRNPSGLQVIWITPLKALAQDIKLAMERACEALDIPWKIGVRTGDTQSGEKQKQQRSMPQCLITTPESMHLLFAQKNNSRHFTYLKTIIVDEWHELLGSKRGTQMELVIARLKHLRPGVKLWGISATIGNLEQALDCLLGTEREGTIIKADIEKKIEVHTLIPEEMEKFPWTGHLGTRLLPMVLPIIENSRSTLIFTNTRAQTEIWYQQLLDQAPHLAGQMAMHHGSLDNSVRSWVENALHEGLLKVVVCTSSLDLGVDFRPVESVVQVGSPKGVNRFIQRAGRSGHQPGATSVAHFLPSHALELLEAAAFKTALAEKQVESRRPLQNAIDVLVQFLVTLAVGEGFREEELFEVVRSAYGYRNLQPGEWAWALQFITTGGETLDNYDEYNKVIVEEGVYKVINRRIARNHRLSIGTIVSDVNLTVKYVGGSRIGTIEESFISRLNKGDVFWFAGKSLRLERIKDNTVLVRRAHTKKGDVPRWTGGRMMLSNQLADLLRLKLENYTRGVVEDREVEELRPLLNIQERWSAIPVQGSLLIEHFSSREGNHLCIYPFAGRAVHEVLASLFAWRMSRIEPISFSMAFNDYGMEFLSDKDIPVEEALELDLFATENLWQDIKDSINSVEMAKRRFREIAAISGLVFQGFPGKNITARHLQASAQMIYDVFAEYDPDNLLLKQATEEVISQQFEQSRLVEVMENLQRQRMVLTHPPRPTPFAFPLMVDRLRERLSSETLQDRIQKMQAQLEEYAANH